MPNEAKEQFNSLRNMTGVFHALSNEGRVSTMEILYAAGEEISFSTIRQTLPTRLRRSGSVPPSSVSHYLKGLIREDLVEKTKAGRYKLTEYGEYALEELAVFGQGIAQSKRQRRVQSLLGELSSEDLRELFIQAKAAGKLAE